MINNSKMFMLMNWFKAVIRVSLSHTVQSKISYQIFASVQYSSVNMKIFVLAKSKHTSVCKIMQKDPQFCRLAEGGYSWTQGTSCQPQISTSLVWLPAAASHRAQIESEAFVYNFIILQCVIPIGGALSSWES